MEQFCSVEGPQGPSGVSIPNPPELQKLIDASNLTYYRREKFDAVLTGLVVALWPVLIGVYVGLLVYYAGQY